MGDTINIPWGLAQPGPNVANAFATGFSQGRQISLAKQADAARADLIANPTDINALSQYALFDPQGSQAFQTAQDFGRAAQARAAAGQFAGAWANGITPGMSPQTVAGMQGQASPPAAAQEGAQGQSAPDPTQHPAFQQIGSAALSGQLGVGQAAQALAGSDPEMFTRMVASLATMDDAQRAKLADANGAIGSAAYTLLNTPQDQWGGVIQTLTPQLLQHGVTQQEIDAVLHSPNPQAALTGLVGQSIGVKEAMDQVTKRAQLGIEAQNANTQAGMLAEEIRQHNFENARGVSDGMGNFVNPLTGQVIYSATGGIGSGNGSIPYANLINAEGGTNPDGSFRTSSKGAIGPAQLMPATAPAAMRLAGYDPNDQRWRTDPQVNMAAGQAYYNSLRQKYGDDLKAAAAYNAGPGAVDKAVASGGPNWLSKLPAETQAYVQKVGGNSVVPTGDMSQHGAAYLASLPSNVASQIKALAEGRMQFPAGFALKSPYWQRMISMVSQYDPTFDAVNYNARAKTRADFTSGKSAQQINALNTAIGHMGQLWNQIPGTASHGFTPLNAAENAASAVFGSPGVTNYESTAGNLAAELTRVWRQAGGNESDIQRYIKELNVNGSAAQKRGAIQNIVGLLQSKLESFGSQYAQGMGTTEQSFQELNAPSYSTIRGIEAGNQTVNSPNHPMAAQRNSAPPAAIAYLRQHPHLAAQFDAKYGRGAAAQALGQ